MLVKEKPLISIILVNWNGMKWLDKCISSLSNQTYGNIEIILSDNNSSDSSLEFVESTFSKVILVRNDTNDGFASGVNKGIKVANGELIMLMNTDAYLGTDAIEFLYEAMITRKLDVIGPIERPYDKAKKLEPFSPMFNIDLFGHPVFNKGRSFYLSGVCLLFSKKLYAESGGLDNNFFMYVEEVDWFWRLRLMKKNFAYSQNVEIYHFGAGSSGGYEGVNENIFRWRNKNTLQMVLKNYSYSTLMFILPFYILINIFESLAFVFVRPSIALTYWTPYVYVAKNLKSITTEHKKVRKMAKISDIGIMKVMYRGSGKPAHILLKLKDRIAR